MRWKSSTQELRELMVPTKCPVSRAFPSYISLINNIYKYNNYNKLIMESTSYFPKEYIYINNLINYLEIQPKYLTDGLTPYDENETPSMGHPKQVLGRTLKVSDSRTLDSHWGN
jgi:hypothetical protein